MNRVVIRLDGGDIDTIVIDKDTNCIEIYDESGDREIPLEEETGEDVLIQGQLSGKARRSLIRALGGDPP